MYVTAGAAMCSNEVTANSNVSGRNISLLQFVNVRYFVIANVKVITSIRLWVNYNQVLIYRN